MLEVGFNCICVNECWDFDMKRGQIFGGLVHVDKAGDTIFVIEFPDGSLMKCVQEWFANYFEIIK